MICWECQLPIANGTLCRTVVDEEHGCLVQHPIHLDCRQALAAEVSGLIGSLLTQLMLYREQAAECRCGGDGHDDMGRYCGCYRGQAMLQAAHDEHAWMKPLVREYSAMRRAGLVDEAEALKMAVLS